MIYFALASFVILAVGPGLNLLSRSEGDGDTGQESRELKKVESRKGRRLCSLSKF